MSQRITIEIKDKIATCLTELPVVCGNSDYVIDFKFDEEWNAHEVKTAIFVINGKSIEQVFAGTVCPIPVIQNTLITWVGVFAGTINDGTLSTSTPALIKCIPCITDGDKVPLPPPEDVYNQIIELINSGLLTGPQGEKGDKGDQGDQGEKGEKGDAGAVKFEFVVELPSDNIKTDIIYLLPNDSGAENNVFTGYVYVDGKWKSLGAISIQGNLSEYVKYTDYATNEKAGVVKRSDSVANRGNIGGIAINTSTRHLGTMMVSRAVNQTINERVPDDYIDASVMDANRCQPICSANLDYALKEALTNPKSIDKNGKDLVGWDDVDRKLAREFLGITNSSSGEADKLMIYETGTANVNFFTSINNMEVITVEKGHLVWDASTTNVLFEIAFYDGSSIQTQTIELPPLKTAIETYSQMFLLGENRLIFELQVYVEGDSENPSAFGVTIKEKDSVGSLSFVMNKIYVETN